MVRSIWSIHGIAISKTTLYVTLILCGGVLLILLYFTWKHINSCTCGYPKFRITKIFSVRSFYQTTPPSWLCECHVSQLPDFSFTERISWAASRETYRQEENAYSLQGIFYVNLPLIYTVSSKSYNCREITTLVHLRSNNGEAEHKRG